MNDLSTEARALLDSAREGDDPTAEDRRRVWQTLGASMAAGAAVGATASVATASTKATVGAMGKAVPAAVSSGKIATWLGVGLVAGVGTMGTAVWVSHVTERAPEVATPQLPAPPTQHRVPLVARERTAPVVDETVAREAPAPAHRQVDPSTPARAAVDPAPASSLGAETSLLESARAALGRNDARAALALLEDHERAYPRGALVEERLASKVFALCGLGRRAEAARVAAELMQRAPGSPLRARVLESCAYGP